MPPFDVLLCLLISFRQEILDDGKTLFERTYQAFGAKLIARF